MMNDELGEWDPEPKWWTGVKAATCIILLAALTLATTFALGWYSVAREVRIWSQ